MSSDVAHRGPGCGLLERTAARVLELVGSLGQRHASALWLAGLVCDDVVAKAPLAFMISKQCNNLGGLIRTLVKTENW